MRAALVDAILAADEAREALGRVRIADVTASQRDQIAETRYGLNTLADNLAADLDADESERLAALGDAEADGGE